jgi:putative hemolysin
MALTPNIFKQMTELIAGSLSAGHYDVRLAQSLGEIRAAQNLRYEVLFKESGGQINRKMLTAEREEDEWDEVAYHVVVLDRKNNDKIVGTVRLVAGHALKPKQKFYTEHAFNLDRLLTHYTAALELSRACVSPQGRGGAILMLMWKFTMQFIAENKYDVLFGCASFAGTDYLKHTEILSYLYHKHLADAELMPIPQSDVQSVAIKDFEEKPGQGEDRGQVPTLLRGYLKIGAQISDYAIIDPVFNTTFVAIYVDTKAMFGSNHLLVNKSV